MKKKKQHQAICIDSVSTLAFANMREKQKKRGNKKYVNRHTAKKQNNRGECYTTLNKLFKLFFSFYFSLHVKCRYDNLYLIIMVAHRIRQSDIFSCWFAFAILPRPGTTSRAGSHVGVLGWIVRTFIENYNSI